MNSHATMNLQILEGTLEEAIEQLADELPNHFDTSYYDDIDDALCCLLRALSKVEEQIKEVKRA